MNIKLAINVCVVCLKSEKLVEQQRGSEIFKKYKFVNAIELSDNLPATFCEKCITRLRISYDFKKQSLASEKYLQNFIQKITKDFQQSVPVYAENDDEILEQFEIIDRTEQDKNSAHNEFQEQQSSTSTENDRLDNQEEMEQQITYQEIKRQNEHEAVQIMTNLNFTINPIEPESSEIYQKSEQMYDILEVDDNSVESEEEEITHLTLEQKSTIDMEDEDQFIYLNLKDNNLELISKPNQPDPESPEDNKTDMFKSTMRRQKRIAEFEENVRMYAQSSGDSHVCTKCSKNFSTRTNLYRHLNSHDGMKNYVCEICKKGFTQSGSLKQHQYIHTGQRPYKCNFCDKGFTQGKSLKFHLRRHTNSRPFYCGVCLSQFRQKDGLKRHIKTRHPEHENPDMLIQMSQKLEKNEDKEAESQLSQEMAMSSD